MKVIVNNGLYFSGKIKDLIKELRRLSAENRTLREIVDKELQ